MMSFTSKPCCLQRGGGMLSAHCVERAAVICKRYNTRVCASRFSDTPVQDAAATVSTSLALLLLPSLPALADTAILEEGMQNNQSLIVTGVLFLMCVPGIWSQVKRAPMVKKVRKTFEVDGPAIPEALRPDTRARQIFQYFKANNYSVKETGEVITFVGTYAPSKGQAAAISFYTFFGLGSVALVLSTAMPSIGGWWYALTGLTPAAWWYYTSKAERQEEVKVKMVTTDDEATTDIIIEGDVEEIERFRKELKLMEKGKIYVKGLFEQNTA